MDYANWLVDASKKGVSVVPEEGVEPTRDKVPADFESAASASSATPGLLPTY
jgi:hypothetical protein